MSCAQRAACGAAASLPPSGHVRPAGAPPTMQLVYTTAYCRARIVLVFSILPTVCGPVNSCQRLIEKRVEKRAEVVRACTCT